jgi:hypothetical protein
VEDRGEEEEGCMVLMIEGFLDLEDVISEGLSGFLGYFGVVFDA